MIVSLYHSTENTLTRIANAVMGADKQATFTADADWEVTHFGVMERVTGPSILCPLKEPTTVRAGDSLTLDLKEVTFEFLDNEWPEYVQA